MNRRWMPIALAAILLVAAGLPALAQVPVPTPISAEQAFDAVVKQLDPLSGAPKKVVLVDVRTRAEFYWVGAPCKVEEFVLKNGKKIVPDFGKVKLSIGGAAYEYEDQGRRRFFRTQDVTSVKLTPIALNIPYRLWDEATAKLVPNGANDINFVQSVERLATERGFEVIIFFCRSGGRSEACLAPFNTSLFEKIYEIDQPNGVTDFGGFEGSTYNNIYLGYRGFPGRITFTQDEESVSWKDAGLPIRIGVNPLPQP